MQTKATAHMIADQLSSPSLLQQLDAVRVSYEAARQRLLERIKDDHDPFDDGVAVELNLLIDLMKAEADMVLNRRVTLIAGVTMYRQDDISRCHSLMRQLASLFDDHDPSPYYAILDELKGR